MNQKLLSKVLATMLVITLTFANFILLGVYATDSYATDAGLENQQTVTNNENVEFDAYFKDEKGNSIHQVKYDFDDENQKLYVSVQVKTGYLKDAKVQITGENNTVSNFQIVSSNETLEMVEKIDSQNNEITLKQLNSGTQVVLQIPIKAFSQEEYDLSNFSKINDIKLTGSYVGNNGKTVSIEKTIKTRNEWTNEAVITLEQELTKFIPYEIEGQTGTLIQTLVKTGLENNALPIEETTVQITVPTINGEKPTTVWVIANSTKATNGKDSVDFTNEQWSYNKETGIITIAVENTANNNKVSWDKNVTDEYVIGYNYQSKVETIQTTQNVEAGMTAYNSTQTNATKEGTLEINAQETLGNIVSANIYVQEQISKGPLYTKLARETIYTEELEVEVSKYELVDEISVNQNIDNFLNAEGNISSTKVSNTNYTYYKTTKISKANFDKMLGTEGSIIIYSGSGQQLGVFDNSLTTDENGDYVLNYSAEENEIKIVTTKPIANGKIEVRHEKAIVGDGAVYTNAQIKNFKKLEVNAKVNAYTGSDANIAELETKDTMELVDPTTQIEAYTSTDTLSTIVENKNVELRVILKTNDVSCDLFKNPMIIIQLPSYIENIDIKDIELLFDDELKIEKYEVLKMANGKSSITIQLTGEDTKYSQDEISKGANLVINTNMTLNKLSASKEENMEVYVTNENAVNYTGTDELIYTKAETLLKAVAPTGIITTNIIEGFNENSDVVTSFNGIEEIGKLETKTEAKNATVRMDIINNYSNKLNNVSILGRIPVEGNKNPVTGEELGSNLTTTLKGAITLAGIDASKVTIYYTTNVNATKDLTNTNNGWTTTPQDFSTIKSYLIVLNDYEMNQGDSLQFTYDITIPENLEHNATTYAIYTMYYDNVKDDEVLQENATATKVGLTTGEGAQLEVKITSPNTEVEEGKEATYNIEIKNTAKTAAKNIKVNITSKQGNRKSNVEEKVIEILGSGETQTITYTVQAKGILVEGIDENIDVSATITADDLEKAIETQTITTPVKLGYLIFSFDTGSVAVETERTEEESIDYVLRIENINAVKKENVVIKNVLPEGLTFESATEGAVYDEQTRTVTYNLGTIDGFGFEVFVITVIPNKLPQGQIEKIIKNKMTITTKDKTLETEEISVRIVKPGLEVKQTSNTKSPVQVGDIITYNVTIKNSGAGTASNINITDIIPEGLAYQEAQYSIGQTTNSMSIGSSKAVIAVPSLEANGQLDVTIKMKANELAYGVEQKEVTNYVTVKANGLDEIKSNEIKHTIVSKGEQTDDPSTDKVEENTYKISGRVWLDENLNGKQEETEKYLSGIKVTLINADDGKIVTDITTGNKKEQTTNENGIYTFANIQPGRYMVIFEYDTEYYGLTIYKESGVNDNMNSDVVLANAIINGETKQVGTTDKLEVIDESKYNVDMGLVVNPTFDLKLDKVITKITAQTSTKTNAYEYKDSKLAKLDLPYKTINDTTIMIEYKIRVTNEGDIAGYAKKIVDYLPKDMKFSSELNPDWYQSTIGNIYNASLANTLILPGETKEVTLLLTKKMNDNNLGAINNRAEICESYNDLGLADIDSTPANQVQKEDDISSADAMISVKTGETYIYIVITLISTGMLAVGIYVINKKVLRRI